MASIRQVAEDAGVSIATVSRVINGTGTVAAELRDRVLASIARCGYSPTVGRKAQGCVALVYTGPFTVGSPYDAACMEGMVAAMQESPFDLQIADIRRDKRADETYGQFFLRKGIVGAVVRCTAAERAVAARMGEEGFPLVVLGDRFDDDALRFAYNDSRQASEEAVEYLISLGHRRIAFAGCERDDGDHADRFQAYLDVLEAHGLVDDRLVFKLPVRREDGSQLMRKLLSHPAGPTAVFVADPLVAAGAVHEAHEREVPVPQRISVIGVDDADLRHAVYPRLTAVCQDAQDLGRRAFAGVADWASTGRKPSQETLRGTAWLEIHHTTGPASAGSAGGLRAATGASPAGS